MGKNEHTNEYNLVHHNKTHCRSSTLWVFKVLEWSVLCDAYMEVACHISMFHLHML